MLSNLLLIKALFQTYKKNAKIRKLLLAGDKFVPEIHLKKLGFTNSACGKFPKNK